MSASIRPGAGAMSRTAPADIMFQPGDEFLGLTVVRLLGAGGVAEVYEVHDGAQRSALKVLQRRFQVDRRQMRRATNEGQILVQIRHPNVINVHEVGFDQGTFWMRMELLEGLDLRDALVRMGPIPVERAVSWAIQAARGAHQCHMFGIVHRDIKPENVFLTADETVKLLDFGIAKLWGDLATLATLETASGGERMPIGTAPYMAPEQVKSERQITPAADVYALGMMLWEMIAGYHPLLRGRTQFDIWEIYRQQLFEEIPPLHELGIPMPLSSVVLRALSKRWQDRQPNGLALADELTDAYRRCAWVFAERTADAGRTSGSRSTMRLDRASGVVETGGAPLSSRRPTHEILRDLQDSGILEVPEFRDTEISADPMFGGKGLPPAPPPPPRREPWIRGEVLNTPPGTVLPIRRSSSESPAADIAAPRASHVRVARPSPPRRRLPRARAIALGVIAFGAYVLLALQVRALMAGHAPAASASVRAAESSPPRAAASPAIAAPPLSSASAAPAAPSGTIEAPLPPKAPTNRPRAAPFQLPRAPPSASGAPQPPPAPRRPQPFSPRMFGSED